MVARHTFVLLLCLSCNPPPATRPPPRAVEPARAAPETAQTRESEAAPRGNPQLIGELEPIVADAIAGARLLRVGETFESGRAEVRGPGLTLTFDYRVYTQRQDAHVSNGRVFEAVRFLRELEEAGVELAGIGQHLATDHGSLACRDVGRDEREIRCRLAEEPTVEPSTLDRPSYLDPPSTRPPRSRPLPGPRPLPTPSWVQVPAITDVLSSHSGSDMEVRGLPLDDGHQALLVTAEIPATGAALCIADGETLRCTDTVLDGLDGVVQASATGWLLIGHSSYGNHRSGETLLVSLSLADDMARADILGMGAVSGYGEGCVDHPGYCVWLQGSLIRLRSVGGGCLEREHEGGWMATHVRVGDRWIDEVVTPREGGPCIERYSVGPNGFERTSCGPSSDTPSCPEELETLTAR